MQIITQRVTGLAKTAYQADDLDPGTFGVPPGGVARKLDQLATNSIALGHFIAKRLFVIGLHVR
jgi:hypothetical protein